MRVSAALLLAAFGLSSPLATAAPANAEAVVYRDTLKPPRFWQTPVWSAATTTRTPTGASPDTFRGPFQAQAVSLSLAQLPAHTWVRLRFKLLLIGSWDGSSPVWGPDLWSLHVRGGQRLMFTSFGNMGAFVNNNLQAFPDDYPWGRHPAWTGATSKDALHFPKLSGGSTLNGELNDSTYPVEVLFPHSAAALVLDFTGIYGDGPQDRQSWGLAGVEVETLSTLPQVDDDALLAQWEQLASADPVRANAALWALVAAGERTNTLITQKVAEVRAEVAANERGLPPVTGLEALRLHRARRILVLLNTPGPNACSAIAHLIPEYFGDPDEPKN
jgi:hypothetical protein